MDFQTMATNELLENGLYREHDVWREGFAPESMPYIEPEVMQAYELGFKRAAQMSMQNAIKLVQAAASEAK